MTLDDDVHERAKDFSKSHGLPFRQALNELVRAGLRAEKTAKPSRNFRIKPQHLGLRPGLSYDNIENLLEIGEGELHR
ncbi:MAG: hypothetical protein ABL995_19560 [Bryobacteraceae bacterium]